MVQLVLLRDLMKELQNFIDFCVLKSQVAGKRKEAELVQQRRKFAMRGSHFDDDEDPEQIRQVLKRFRMIQHAHIYSTIKKCESLGLIGL